MAPARSTRTALLAAALAVAALGAATWVQRDLLIFNRSHSMPEGLYVRDDGDVTLGAIVTVRARDVAPLQAAQRNLVGDRDRFIKRVAAVGGDEVCGDGERLSVNGGPVARRNTDAGVALGWRGCRVLSEGEVLLLGETDDSFDGRYWGPTRVELIEGVWRVL